MSVAFTANDAAGDGATSANGIAPEWEFIDCADVPKENKKRRRKKPKSTPWLDLYLSVGVSLLGLIGLLSLDGAEERWGFFNSGNKPIEKLDRQLSDSTFHRGEVLTRNLRSIALPQGKRFQSPYAPKQSPGTAIKYAAPRSIRIPKSVVVKRFMYLPAGAKVGIKVSALNTANPPKIRKMPLTGQPQLPLPVRRPVVVKELKTYTSLQRTNLNDLVRRRAKRVPRRLISKRKARLRKSASLGTSPALVRKPTVALRRLGQQPSEYRGVRPERKSANWNWKADWPRWAKAAMKNSD